MSDPILEGVRRFFDDNHEALEARRRRYAYFHRRLAQAMATRVPPGQRVLEVGCGTGHLLAALQPAIGVGIDISQRAVAAARSQHAGRNLHFLEGDGSDPGLLRQAGGPFDVIVLVNTVTLLTDVQRTFEHLHIVSHPRTRLLVYSYSRLWQPAFRLAEMLGLRLGQPSDSWLPPEETRHMLYLGDWEVVRNDTQVLLPIGVPVLADVVNRYLAHLPLLDAFCAMYGVVARPAPHLSRGFRSSHPSTSVVVPCRNEAGHIRPLVQRLPELGPNSEVLFVEGGSTDDTRAVIEAVIAERPELPLRLLTQTGKGKGDAVRLGFSQARGEVVLILDSDMGVAPEDIPKFVGALVEGKGEFVNGSRLVYPMEDRAMRFLNLLANKFFALLFRWLLGQQVRDTLCGTKALYREDYERIARNRAHFGDFDPFGDFDLLFGAARLNLRIVDVAVRYHQRTYGATNISRFRHGLLLLRMSLFAAGKLKFL